MPYYCCDLGRVVADAHALYKDSAQCRTIVVALAVVRSAQRVRGSDSVGAANV